MEALAGLGIIAYVGMAIIGAMLFFSPLFIWHHVAKMRKEVDEKIALLEQTASSLLQAVLAMKREQIKTNELFVEMQQRYIKTMQYVCDRLADICDHAGVAEHGGGEPPLDGKTPLAL